MSEQKKEWDVFICYAGEDRDKVVKPLAENLRKIGLRVWYDKFVLTIGDSLRRKIDEGLANSQYGIVILSPSFFKKEWPQKELDGLIQRESGGEKVILPIWHHINEEDIKRYSPILAAKVAGKTAGEMDNLVKELCAAMHGKIPILSKTQLQDKKKKSFRIPKIGTKSFNPYDETQQFIKFLSAELKERCEDLSDKGVSLSVIDKGGRTCYRIVYNGKTKYSLDVWIGGFAGDSSLGFFGTQGVPHFSSGGMNASGSFVWDQERGIPVLDFQDFSLLDSFKVDKHIYTKEEFIDVLWHKICDALESEN